MQLVQDGKGTQECSAGLNSILSLFYPRPKLGVDLPWALPALSEPWSLPTAPRGQRLRVTQTSLIYGRKELLKTTQKP